MRRILLALCLLAAACDGAPSQPATKADKPNPPPRRDTKPASPDTKAAPRQPTSKADPEDPWPECAAVRAWLSKNLADPEGWQVVRWVKRLPYPQHVAIHLTYRAKNRFGGKSIYLRSLSVRDGMVIDGGEPILQE